MTQQPAGWYPDPQTPNTQRWWDGSSWTPHARPAPQTQPVPTPPPPKRSGSKVWWVIGGIVGGFLVLIMIIGAIGSSISESASSGSSSSGDAGGTFTRSEIPSPTSIDPQAEVSQSAAMSSALAEATAREQDKTQFKDVGERDWQLIAKNPDAHLGEKVVIYGKVTQADSAMGDKLIRVSTGGQPADYYTINTVAKEGVDGVFANIVEGDLVTMWARVWGSKTYDTTIGGSTTAPEVKVNVIEVTGHE